MFVRPYYPFKVTINNFNKFKLFGKIFYFSMLAGKFLVILFIWLKKKITDVKDFCSI